MSRKQRIILSTTGIFLVLLILVGLTYAYFLTRIKGNTNDKSISVSTANLELKYDDIEQVLISEENVEPGKTWTKKFSATNTGSKKVESYGVALENVINTLERTEDLVYTLNCTSSLGTTCNKVETEQEFPVVGKILITNSIESKEVQSYELTITYKEQNIDQSVDMNKQFSAKVNLANPSTFGALGSGTLASAIIDNGANVKISATETKNTKTIKYAVNTSNAADGSSWNEEINDFTNDGLFRALDDYGISYYFRGPITNNYVSFKGMKWQIIRINGDGSIRLASTAPVGNSFYNEKMVDNAYAGYMYGLTGVETNEERCLKLNESNVVENIISTYSTKETCEANGGTWTTNGYEATHANIKNSTIKDFLDNWYSTNLVGKTNTNGELYTDYISDEIFCNDKTINNGKGYGNNLTYYSGYTRISDNRWKSPTFMCANGTNNDLSRFTVEKQILKNGNVTNGKLTYPVGLLSGDEARYAGSIYGYYKITISLRYNGWTMTPHYYEPDKYQLIYIIDSSHPIWANSSNNQKKDIHPVINLKKDVLIESGDGTSSNPYTIKLTN